MIEFHILGIVLLVPFVYVLLAVLEVQRTTYGLTQAVREAGRVFAVTGDADAASIAADVALRDQDVDPETVGVALTCDGVPCFRPGGQVTVTATTSVGLPFLPDFLADAVRADIPVEAVHVAVIDRFRDQ